ncbi:unnamed protein product [Rhizophagus irregularis]|nr:unnamed protein product [Rhizophagus irregularis]
MTRTKRFIISLIVKEISLGHTNLLLIVKIFSVIHSLRFISTPQENDTEEEYDDHTLMRFATARSFRLDKTKEQLIETITWRDLEGIDSIPLPILNPGTPILYPKIYGYFGGNSVHKTDKEGRGIYIERAGYHDSKRLAKYVKQEELTNWHIRCQEFSHRVIMPELSRRAGKIIDKETVIFDCEGMGFHQLHLPSLTLYRAIAELDQKYYPGRLGKLFVVNAPFIFVKIWR